MAGFDLRRITEPTLRVQTVEVMIVFRGVCGVSIGRLVTPSNPVGSGTAAGTGRLDSYGPRPAPSIACSQMIAIRDSPNSGVCVRQICAPGVQFCRTKPNLPFRKWSN